MKILYRKKGNKLLGGLELSKKRGRNGSRMWNEISLDTQIASIQVKRAQRHLIGEPEMFFS